MTTIIPFPGAQRFGVVDGAVVEATGFGLEALSADDCLQRMQSLERRAKAYVRDGRRALAKVCLDQMMELMEARIAACQIGKKSQDKKRTSGGTGRSFSGTDGGRYRD